LLKEIEGYRYRQVLDQPERKLRHDVAIPLELETAYGDVNLITTSMVFGYPRDVTVSEIAIECFFPQDKESAEVLKRFTAKPPPVTTTETQNAKREKLETTCPSNSL
jgi:hypothetical protein